MNWIIRYSNKMEYHTHLNLLLKPILAEISTFKWLIADLEYFPDTIKDLPVNFDHDYFILSPSDFQKLIHADPQIIWGVFLGIPAGVKIAIDESDLPFAEGNDVIWTNDNIQHHDAQIEIVCFDSRYTIIKFKDKNLSDKFKAYFDEAIELKKFKNKSAPHY